MSKQLANDEIEADTLSVTLPGTSRKLFLRPIPANPRKQRSVSKMLTNSIEKSA
jgi:hypothetical protein